MATDKGVIHGYTGVAAVDAKHQIIVEAQAHGTGSEQEVLLPVVEALATMRTSAAVLTADAGYHGEANLAALAALHVPALIADPDMRKRDERFADREHHTTAPNPLHDKSSEDVFEAAIGGIWTTQTTTVTTTGTSLGVLFQSDFAPVAAMGPGNVVLTTRMNVVPEPSSFALLLAGMGSLFLVARRRRSGSAPRAVC